MREIDLNLITEKVTQLCIDANYNIGEDVYTSLRNALKTESSTLGKEVITQILENDDIAKQEQVPMCQDTGVVVVFLEIGSEIIFKGNIYDAINEGVRRGYKEGYLRKSVVKHPIDRINTGDNTPAIIHTKLVPGENIKITLAPKGGGSENMSTVQMLTPAATIDDIKDLVKKVIFDAGGKPCPPIIVGIGLGGNLEKAALIAKEALLRKVDDESIDPIANKLEKELLEEINQLGVGPMGFGGTTTALAVKVNTYPCHIASLPVAINIQCHSARHKEITI